MALIVGYTGTSKGGGMTRRQCQAFRTLIQSLQPTWFHHGDCVGGDAQAHDITAMECEFAFIHVHPADVDPRYRANKRGDVVSVAVPPLVRNHDIVDAAEVMVAAPRTKDEELRSGTWATVRYTWKLRKPLYFVYFDGSIEEYKYADVR